MDAAHTSVTVCYVLLRLCASPASYGHVRHRRHLSATTATVRRVLPIGYAFRHVILLMFMTTPLEVRGPLWHSYVVQCQWILVALLNFG